MREPDDKFRTPFADVPLVQSRRGPRGKPAAGIGIACAALAFIGGVSFLRPGASKDRAMLLALVWFLGSVAAIGCGAVGLLRADRRARDERWVAAGVLVAGAILLVTCGRVAPRQLTQYSSRVPCASNLRQIGQALAMYAEANGGRYPSDLEGFAISGTLEPQVLICPDGSDTPAKGATPAELAAEFRQAGHVSFVYLGRGRRAADFTADDVLAYDRPTDHDGTGSNILCGDYHVEWVPTGILNQMLAQPHPTTRPAGTATSRSGS